MKKYFFYLLSFFSIFFSLKMFPQIDSLIIKKILILDSSILIDRDFIDQNNFNIYKDNTKLPDSLYSINFSTGFITFNKQLIKDTILVQYKLLEPDFSYSKRDTSLYIPVIEKEPTFLNTESYNSTAFQKLQTNGTFQRTFSNGNNQNFSINTDINLQMIQDQFISVVTIKFYFL